MKKRRAQVKRVTRETSIVVKLNIDGTGNSLVKTGIPFLDHMLTLFARHAVVDLYMRCEGDLEVDAHHTVEDCGIGLGRNGGIGAQEDYPGGKETRHVVVLPLRTGEGILSGLCQ